MTILLIRHGHTDAVAAYLAGRTPGVGLNDKGREQVRRLGEIVGALPLVAVCSSPLDRTIQTAQPIAAARQKPIDVRPDLAEVDFGEWTGRTFADLETDPRWRAYNSDREHAGIPGGECLREVQQRSVAELRRIRAQYGTGLVAAVSHAEVIRCAIAALRGLNLDQAMRLQVEPAKVTLLRGATLESREEEANLDACEAAARL